MTTLAVTTPTENISDLTQTALGRVAQSLAPGQYAKLPDNSSLNNLPIGYSLLYWSDSGVWDPVKKEIAWSGGPGTCCANPATYQRVSYNALTETWNIQAMPWSRQGHAYDGNALDPRTGTHYFALSGMWVKAFNGSTWSDLPSLSQYSSTVQSLSWFPDINNGNGGLFYLNGDWSSINWWNGQTWQVVPGASRLALDSSSNFMEYNPVHKVMWAGSSYVSYKIDKDLNVVKLKDAPVKLSAGSAYVSVDPISGKYIVTSTGRTWWEFDIINDTWTQLNSLTNSPITKSGTSHFHVPVPELGVIVYFSHYYGTREVWVYKHNGTISSAPAPTTPTLPTDPTSLSSVLGNLTHDGPATPEQISLILPVTGALPQSATASVRYKQSGTSSWITGHPLYRIRPDYSLRPNRGSVPDAFAWPIIDVSPGTTYDIEVTVSNGGASVVKNLTHTTRSLPRSAGVANKIITSSTPINTVQTILNNLNPGDVVEFENGTYTGGIIINRSGTVDNPIYIRGRSRDGAVLSKSNGSIIQFQNASNIIIENLSLRGSGVDSNTSASSRGIEFWSGASMQSRVTVRNVTMSGVDVGIKAYREVSEFLAYDNTLVGNNTWTASMIDTNATWNDDGINIAGFGNSAFNNTIKGFGDSLALDPQQWSTDSVGIHFYRNEIISGGDDGFEADGGHRNISFYDNRLTNTMTLLSLDALFGGPLVAARNISINTGRGPFKFNSKNSGQFVYNNTIIRTTDKNGWGWVQYNNGAQNAWGYRNNILIHQGSGSLLAIEPGGESVIDFTHNSWFPNKSVWWSNSGGSYNDMATAYSRLPATTPIFSGSTKRHEQDAITTISPWASSIILGSDYKTEITEKYVPVLANGTAPKNSGVAIPNITSGFSGGSPDRGAIISGRSLPTWGDRTGVAVPSSPSAPSTPVTPTTPTTPTTPLDPTVPTVPPVIGSSDNQAPGTPGQPTSSSITQTGVTLSWSASTDNVGVTGYRVYQNGSQIATPSTNSYNISNLSAGSTYSFTVSAVDAAGNLSTQSISRSVTTLAVVGSQVPVIMVSQPRGVEAFRGDRSIRIIWTNPLEPDFAGIKIVRKSEFYPSSPTDGVVIYDGRSAITFTDTNLINGNVYYYAIYSYDTRGNYAAPLKLSIDPTSSGSSAVTQTAVVPENNFPSRFDVRTTLLPGSSSNDVRTLQQILRTTPEIYPEMTVNGVYDQATMRAVERFQIRYGIVSSGSPETTGFGVVGPRTREAIVRVYFGNSVSATNQNQTIASTPTVTVTTNQSNSAPAYPRRTLTLGETSDDVYLLQRFLNQKGYTVSYSGLGSAGNETDYFGLATRRAVERFQIANNLNSSGQVDNQTLARISEIATGGTAVVRQPQIVATTSISAIPTTTSTLSSQLFTRVLYKGSRGEDVRELQKFLNNNGFRVAESDSGSPGNETDFFGLATENAVIRFQNAFANDILIPNDLVVGNGRFGISTRRKVLEIMLQNLQRQTGPTSTSTTATTTTQ